MRDRKVLLAAMILRNGDPLPLDLSVYLLDQGIDLARFERRFSSN